MRKSEPFTVYVWLTMNGVKWHNELRWVHSIGILIVIIMLIMITAVRVLDVRVIASIEWFCCCQCRRLLMLSVIHYTTATAIVCRVVIQCQRVTGARNHEMCFEREREREVE